MDAHQAYCRNFLALTQLWSRGLAAVMAAWVLSVMALALTVAAAWVVSEVITRGAGIVDRAEVSRIEFWVAVVMTPVNYLRYFGSILGAADASAGRFDAPRVESGRAAFAVVSLLGPAAVILILLLHGGD